MYVHICKLSLQRFKFLDTINVCDTEATKLVYTPSFIDSGQDDLVVSTGDVLRGSTLQIPGFFHEESNLVDEHIIN